jgi:hypothetical protein
VTHHRDRRYGGEHGERQCYKRQQFFERNALHEPSPDAVRHFVHEHDYAHIQASSTLVTATKSAMNLFSVLWPRRHVGGQSFLGDRALLDRVDFRAGLRELPRLESQELCRKTCFGRWPRIVGAVLGHVRSSLLKVVWTSFAHGLHF